MNACPQTHTRTSFTPPNANPDTLMPHQHTPCHHYHVLYHRPASVRVYFRIETPYGDAPTPEPDQPGYNDTNPMQSFESETWQNPYSR